MSIAKLQIAMAVQSATKHSLVIIDEFGKGTATVGNTTFITIVIVIVIIIIYIIIITIILVITFI